MPRESTSAPYRRILVPIDGSPTASRGLDLALLVAARSGATLRIVHVLDDLRFTAGWEPGAVYATELLPRIRSSAAALVAAAGARARSASVAAETAVLECFAVRASEVIVGEARAWGADLIVLGTHGRHGADRAFMGSDAEEVARTAPVPVLLARCPAVPAERERASLGAHAFQRVLVPIDGSVTSRAGLSEAIRLARPCGARIRLLHVVDELSFPIGIEVYTADVAGLLQEAGRKLLVEGEALCAAAGVAVESRLFETLGGRVVDAVSEEVDAWRADLVVIGTHGRRGVRRLFLGSDAEKVLRQSSVPVLLVRTPDRAANSERMPRAA